MEKLEWKIELVKKLKWKIDEWVIKGGRSELERRNFWRENFGCLRGFWEIEEKFERKKIPKRERILKMMRV